MPGRFTRCSEEITAPVEDSDSVSRGFSRSLASELTWEIDRAISAVRAHGRRHSFETYPRMDVLVDVEGEPDAIEVGIEAIGLRGWMFTSERLPISSTVPLRA